VLAMGRRDARGFRTRTGASARSPRQRTSAGDHALFERREQDPGTTRQPARHPRAPSLMTDKAVRPARSRCCDRVIGFEGRAAHGRGNNLAHALVLRARGCQRTRPTCSRACDAHGQWRTRTSFTTPACAWLRLGDPRYRRRSTPSRGAVACRVPGARESCASTTICARCSTIRAWGSGVRDAGRRIRSTSSSSRPRPSRNGPTSCSGRFLAFDFFLAPARQRTLSDRRFAALVDGLPRPISPAGAR